MSAKITVEIRYTQAGDATPLMRVVSVEQKVPVTTVGPWTDKILTLPGIDKTSKIGIDLPDKVDGPIGPEQIARALEQERIRRVAAEVEAEATKCKAAQVLLAWALSQAGGAEPAQADYNSLRALGAQYAGPWDGRSVLSQSREGSKVLVEAKRRLTEEQANELDRAIEKIDVRVERIDAERAEAEKVQKTERDRAKQEREAKEKANAEQRETEIAAWAAEHGSPHLRALLRVGESGWPLYLHERLAVDFGKLGAELDNDGTNEVVVTASLAACERAEHVATRACDLGLYPGMDSALDDIEIVLITFESDDDTDQYAPEPEPAEFAVMHGYRPGGEAFSKYAVRFPV